MSVIIEILLNPIFEKEVFAEEWTLGVIKILFKDCETNTLKYNYGGITLLSMLGKILVGILNNRLIDLINEKHISEENQGGFRNGYRTTDHLFILQALINHYIKVERKELFLCFVDFRKAFNKVSHSILWMKLFKYGINGNFLTLVKSMYEQVKSCVKSKSSLTYSYLLTNWLANLYGRIQSPRPDVMPDRREGITRAAGFGFACIDT